MEQLAIRDIGVSPSPGRFTFALHKYEANASMFRIGRPDRVRTSKDRDGLCLVFGPPGNNTPNNIDYLKRIMAIPFLPQLIDPHGPIWFQQMRKHVVISNHLEGAFRVSQAEAGAGLGLLQKQNGVWVPSVWPYFDLFHHCFNLEKVASNCADCINDGTECVCYCVQSQAHEQKVKAPTLPIENERGLLIDDLEPDEIIRLCKKISRNSAWEFVHPKDTNYFAFAPTLLQIEELFFDEVDQNREERRERAARAVATRRAVKRCKAECSFEGHCKWCVRPYHGRPLECQEGSRYGHLSVQGPYSMEQFTDAFQRYWESLPHIDRRKVELIARNAGLSTWVFGHELVLSKMNKEMDAVEFIRPTTGDVRLVDFEEAVMLCTTPYRDGKEYVYPSKSGSWREEFWNADVPPMPDEEFFAYIEVCVNDCTLQGGLGFSNSYPEIRIIEWHPGPGHISFDTDKSWCCGTVNNVFDFTLRYSQYAFPKTAQWIRGKGEVGTASSETSSDTQP